MKGQKIDFVLPWVDGSDPVWLEEKARHSGGGDARNIRYRDWDNLQYWFRGVEEFAPWVNRIHFITYGHLPAWMNTDHPKLHIVRHEDYIPSQYLPTFSANTIELNIHRIQGLAEHFVYFNDDMFLLQPLKPEFFFRGGKPCDTAAMNPADTMQLTRPGSDSVICHFAYNDMQYINRQYSVRQSVFRHPTRWLTPRYGNFAVRNLLLLAWPRFTGFVDFHLPQPYLKSSFRAAWKDLGEVMDATCRRTFRTDQDVNQWYIRYRQLAENRFYPVSPVADASYCIDGSDTAAEAVRTRRKPMICLNDSPNITEEDFPLEKERIRAAFEAVLPRKSEYER